jgi:hypothetical protein
MDLAQVIFQVGIGIGALLVGAAVMLIALSVRRLARDARSLAEDARRLARLAEEELPAILGSQRGPIADHAFGIEPAPTEKPAVEEVAASRPAVGPVQSAHAREDESIA